MADKYLMNSHKLQWHTDRVNAWLKGERIPPIHIDVGLSKGCNIHCHYCFGSLQGNEYQRGEQKVFPRDDLLNYMRSAGKVGVRSMGIIGESEPTLNSALNDAIIEGSRSGIDMALGTNGILFEPSKDVLENLKWLRYNLSAASEESYKKLHNSEEYYKVIDSISKSVELKNKNNLDVTIGIQMVLTPKDVYETVPLAKLGKELGVNYFVIKQCSDTLESKLGVFNLLGSHIQVYEEQLKEAEKISTEDYDVIVKWKKIRDTKQDYNNCLGVPFLLYSSGDGKLFPCGMFFNEEYWEDFLMGDLTKNSFEEIFKSERYWEVVDRVKNMGTSKCYVGCRTHAVNSYLWELKNPPKHVNFI